MLRFKSAGALTSADQDIYIVRDADAQVASLLQQGRFVHLSEPRQQGKTSLINRLSRVTGLAGHSTLKVTASALVARSPDDWYELIGLDIRRELDVLVAKRPDLFDEKSIPEPPRTGKGWHTFLLEIATRTTRPVILAIDEVDAIRFEGSESFFSAIKNVSDTNDSRLSFVLSGCFHPVDLVQNELLSPFNAANYVRLKDFSEDQVVTLVGMGPWPQERVSTLAREIFYWTAGHPSITQYFCERLPDEPTEEHVRAIARSYPFEDVNNVPRIRQVLDGDPSLRQTLDRILDGQHVPLSEGRHDEPTKRLRLLGVVKVEVDKNYHCVPRNRLYEEIFKQPARQPQMFISYRHEKWTALTPLTSGLEKHGVRFFVDRSLPPGEPFPDRLRKAIRSAPIFVLVLTPGDFVRCHEPGDWLFEEVMQALSVGARIIPVLVDPCPFPKPHELPVKMRPICALQFITMAANTVDAAVNELVAATAR